VTIDAVDVFAALVVLGALVWGVGIVSWQEGFEAGVKAMSQKEPGE
jgi:hypothetical protein